MTTSNSKLRRQPFSRPAGMLRASNTAADLIKDERIPHHDNPPIAIHFVSSLNCAACWYVQQALRLLPKEYQITETKLTASKLLAAKKEGRVIKTPALHLMRGEEILGTRTGRLCTDIADEVDSIQQWVGDIQHNRIPLNEMHER